MRQGRELASCAGKRKGMDLGHTIPARVKENRTVGYIVGQAYNLLVGIGLLSFLYLFCFIFSCVVNHRQVFRKQTKGQADTNQHLEYSIFSIWIHLSFVNSFIRLCSPDLINQ